MSQSAYEEFIEAFLYTQQEIIKENYQEMKDGNDHVEIYKEKVNKTNQENADDK